MKPLKKKAKEIVSRFRVRPHRKFRVTDVDPRHTAGLDIAKDKAQRMLAGGVERLADLQGKLAAQDRWALLVILQGMDAAGKDGTIKHVMSGVNPQGVEVHSFKAPSDEELDHDFLWRAARRLPERGRIGIFNRSHYEEVLVVRVHSELLEKEKLPVRTVGKKLWEERYEDINAYERYLARNGYVIRKFFLNVSNKEQKRRLLERLETPEKGWKFSIADVAERRFWKDYMSAYEELIAATSTEWAPWYVIPADNKWFARLAVATIVIDALEDLDLRYPRTDARRRRELARVRRELERS